MRHTITLKHLLWFSRIWHKQKSRKACKTFLVWRIFYEHFHYDWIQCAGPTALPLFSIYLSTLLTIMYEKKQFCCFLPGDILVGFGYHTSTPTTKISHNISFNGNFVWYLIHYLSFLAKPNSTVNCLVKLFYWHGTTPLLSISRSSR